MSNKSVQTASMQCSRTSKQYLCSYFILTFNTVHLQTMSSSPVHYCLEKWEREFVLQDSCTAFFYYKWLFAWEYITFHNCRLPGNSFLGYLDHILKKKFPVTIVNFKILHMTVFLITTQLPNNTKMIHFESTISV